MGEVKKLTSEEIQELLEKVSDREKRKQMEESVERLIRIARAELITTKPFWGYLAMLLKLKVDYTCLSIATDGEQLIYNPLFFEIRQLSTSDIKFILAHEILHLCLNHLLRRETRNPVLWNIAADYATNNLLIKDMNAPADTLYDVAYENKSAEEIYEILKQQPQKTIDILVPCQFDEHREIDPKISQEFKEKMISVAETARSQGNLPGFVEAIIDKLIKPKIDWRTVLRKFIRELRQIDYTYKRPNRKYMMQGIIVPSLRDEGMPDIAVAIDSSGSISDEELRQFVSEIAYMARCGFDFTMHLFVCDAEVHTYKKIHARDFAREKIAIRGRGGTDFRPVFEVIRQKYIRPAALFYLTDGWGTYPEYKPSYPVIWVLATDHCVPFGTKIVMKG